MKEFTVGIEKEKIKNGPKLYKVLNYTHWRLWRAKHTLLHHLDPFFNIQSVQGERVNGFTLRYLSIPFFILPKKRSLMASLEASMAKGLAADVCPDTNGILH